MATSQTKPPDTAQPKPQGTAPSQTPAARTVSRQVFNDFAAI